MRKLNFAVVGAGSMANIYANITIDIVNNSDGTVNVTFEDIIGIHFIFRKNETIIVINFFEIF